MKKIKFFNSEAVANNGGAMEADTISKHGRSSKSQTSRGNNFLFRNSCFLLLTASLIIFGCNNNSGGEVLGTVPDDDVETITAIVENGNSYNGIISTVRITTGYWDYNDKYHKEDEFATGTYSNGGFELPLPSTIPSKYLTTINDELVDNNISVSDTRATWIWPDLIGYNKNGEATGMFWCGTSNEYIRAYYVFVDRDVKITGDGNNKSFDVSFSKGWNICYIIDSENSTIYTTKMQSGMKWYFSGWIEKATITLVAPTLGIGDTEGIVTGTIVSKAELKSVKISINDAALQDLPAAAYPKDEANEDTYLLAFIVAGIDANCTVKVVVDNGAGELAEATVTIAYIAPLGEAITFQFAYQSSGSSLNVLALPELAIVATWQNPPIGFNFTGSFVTLTAAEFGTITTKEDLKERFDINTPVANLFISVPSPEKIYFIAKNGDNYFLVETTERYRDTNAVPANRVTISYKQ